MFESSDEDERKEAESPSRVWEPQPGPSRCESSRQGYCSYCRVLYRDLDQHLSSLQHLDSVRASSRSSGCVSSFGISQTKHTLLERFLQDVMQHHPHRYNDPRPSHIDLPPVGDADCCGRVPVASTCPSASQQRDTDTCSQSEERLRGRVCPERLSVPVGQQEVGRTQAPPPVHRKAHRKTDRRKSSISSDELTSPAPRPPHHLPVPSFAADSGPGPGPGSGHRLLQQRSGVSWPTQRQETLRDQGDSVDQTIEQVIQMYCSGISLTPCPKEMGSLDFSLPCSLGTQSDDWDAPVQVKQVKQVEGRDFSHLTDARVDLKDQVYPAHLDLALRSEPRPDKDQDLPRPQPEEVLPLSEDVPKAFRGKTWSQIRREDEERVEKLVRQFREGKFVCYFDSESLARYGRRSRSSRRGDHEAGPETEALPLMDHDGDSGESVKRVRRRRKSCRLASRCQVVKVSQATQTFRLVAPIIHQLLSEPPHTHATPPSQEVEERTPNMLRWRRLPPSYSTVITPLQPRTSLVYLLCSPPGPTCPAGVVPKRCRKKRRPLDPQGLKVKYKRFPVRLYDLGSNQILKNAPKGFIWYQGSTSSSPPPPCVRQLFRSLSTDLNTERLPGEPGGQRSSDASRCPLTTLSKDVALSDKRSVLRRRGEVSEAPPPLPPVGSEQDRVVTHQVTRPAKRRARAEATPPTLRRGTLRQTGSGAPQHQNQRGRTRRGRSCEKAQR